MKIYIYLHHMVHGICLLYTNQRLSSYTDHTSQRSPLLPPCLYANFALSYSLRFIIQPFSLPVQTNPIHLQLPRLLPLIVALYLVPNLEVLPTGERDTTLCVLAHLLHVLFVVFDTLDSAWNSVLANDAP